MGIIIILPILRVIIIKATPLKNTRKTVIITTTTLMTTRSLARKVRI